MASDDIQRDIVTTSLDYASHLKVSADVDFAGWGATVQFNFAMNNEIKFSSNSQLFIAWRKIVHGFEGYSTVPNFTDNAKMVLNDGGYQKFYEHFGDYYVKGCVKGASMKLVVRTTKTDSSGSNSLDLGLAASWSGMGMSIGGGVGFSTGLSRSSSQKFDSVEVHYSG